MMDFKSTYNHHEITARVHTDGSVNYMTEAIQEKGKYYTSSKEFDSLDAITTAIDKYELAQRKDFVNKTAYLIEREYRGDSIIHKVTVTSLTEDGNEAWIKTAKDERRKVKREHLYSSLEACEAYCGAYKATVAVFEREKEQLLTVLNRFAWTPEVKS